MSRSSSAERPAQCRRPSRAYIASNFPSKFDSAALTMSDTQKHKVPPGNESVDILVSNIQRARLKFHIGPKLDSRTTVYLLGGASIQHCEIVVPDRKSTRLNSSH